MANKTKATPQKKAREKGPETPDAPLPLLDLSGAAVTKMIQQAAKRGYVTYEQLNAVMPSEEVTSEKIEDILATLNEMGINVVETEEAEADEEEVREKPESEETESGELVGVTPNTPAKFEAKEPVERTDDPVRMYLSEMRSIGLLSRQGEIAIAKRIAAGREAMIAGLCQSPLTFQAVIIWRDELNDGKVFLHDIIDLEATYAGPDAKAVPAAVPSVDAPPAAPAGATPFLTVVSPQPVAPPSAAPAPTPFKPKPLNGGDGEAAAGGWHARERPGRGRSRERHVARRHRGGAQAQGAGDLRQHRRYLQAPAPTAGQDIHNKLHNETLSPAQERKYKKLKKEIIQEVKSLRNQARIDALVEQLYDINKRLVGHEGRLMRLAESHGVSREDFLRNYQAPNSIRTGSTACRSSRPGAGRASWRAIGTA